MNDPHPEILTPCLISPSPITLHLPPPIPDVSLLYPPCETTSPLLALAEPARADRHSSVWSGQAQHAQQHLLRLPETCPPGAEVSGGWQALPSQLFQVNSAAMASDYLCFIETFFSYVTMIHFEQCNKNLFEL